MGGGSGSRDAWRSARHTEARRLTAMAFRVLDRAQTGRVRKRGRGGAYARHIPQPQAVSWGSVSQVPLRISRLSAQTSEQASKHMHMHAVPTLLASLAEMHMSEVALHASAWPNHRVIVSL